MKHLPFEKSDNGPFNELNRLLCMEPVDDEFRGVRVDDIRPPVIVIEGAPGTGKTTLVLQSAVAAARSGQWDNVVLFSSEQPVTSLQKSANAFGFVCSDDEIGFAELSSPADLNRTLRDLHLGTPSLFSKQSFRDMPGLSKKFAIPPPTMDVVPAYIGKGLSNGFNDVELIARFNEMLEGYELFNVVDMNPSSIKMRPTTSYLYNEVRVKQPQAADPMLRRLNRLLLEDLYPTHINHCGIILFLTMSPGASNGCQNLWGWKQAISDLTDNPAIAPKFLFYFDSLNGMDREPPVRQEIADLFGILRLKGIPAVATIEQDYSETGGTTHRGETAQSAAFMADVVIRLSRDTHRHYMLHFLQILKSRPGGNALGRHIYKIRQKTDASNISIDPRSGIVVYPSVHSILSRSKPAKKHLGKYLLCENDGDVYMLMKSTHIQESECLAVVGPHGTHKLALAINLATGANDNGSRKLLIVHFGDSDVIDFGGVAWTPERQNDGWQNLVLMQDEAESHQKFWLTHYKSNDDRVSAVCINFRIGELTPEECFYIVDNTIRSEKPSAVLTTDTAELWGGFPLLRTTEFFSALIDLFGMHKIVSVIVGVQETTPGMNEELNFALLARANYRIVLSHFPDTNTLMRKLVGSNGKSAIQEQLVGLVIDNVTGKHYGRNPVWLHVEQGQQTKTLRCFNQLHVLLSAIKTSGSNWLAWLRIRPKKPETR